MEKTTKTDSDKAFLERLKKHAPEVLEAEVDFDARTIQILGTKEKETIQRKRKKAKKVHGSR